MDNTPICVYQAADVGEAQLVKDLLLDAGIEARVVGDNQPYAGLLAVTTVDVIVSQADQARAIEIVATFEQQQQSREDASEWKCSGCGQTVPGTFDVCYQCGTERLASE